MIGCSVEYQIDKKLYQLYENLRACDPSVFVMVKALNVVLQQYPALGPMISTCHELECFIEAIEEYELTTEGLL